MSPLGSSNNDNDDDRKRAAITRFWAVRECDAFRSAAIFTDWDDCSLYVEATENDGDVDYKVFDEVEGAIKYILPYWRKDLPSVPPSKKELKKAPPASTTSTSPRRNSKKREATSTRKRSAGEAFFGSLCRPAKAIKTTDSDGENKREEDSKPPVQLEKKWLENFELFREFKKAYPDYIFRQSRTEDDTFQGMSSWASRQRVRIRAYRANPEEAQRTDALKVKMLLEEGFDSEPGRRELGPMTGDLLSKWEEYFQKATEWNEQYGTLKISQTADGKLFRWVAYQRELLLKHQTEPEFTRLDDERIQRLKDLGLEPAATLLPPRGSKKHAATSGRERSGGEAFSGSPSRPAKALTASDSDDENQGFEDNQPPSHWGEKWQVKFELFKEFKKVFPDCIVDRSRTEDDTYLGLFEWAGRERSRIRAYQENPEEATRANALKVKMVLEEGFKPKPERLERQERLLLTGAHLAKWEEYFQKAKEWNELYGTLKVSMKADGKLSRWVAYQREAMQKHQTAPLSTKLDDERIQRLKDLGLEPNVKKKKYLPHHVQEVFLEKLKEAEAAPPTPIVVQDDNSGIQSADPPTTGTPANAARAAMSSDQAEESVTEETAAIVAMPPAASADSETKRCETPNDEEPGFVGQRTATPTPTKGKLGLIDKKWERKFQLLQEYKELYGTCAVHRGTVVGTKFETLHRYQNYQREKIQKVQKMQEEAPEKVNEKDAEKVRRLLELGLVMKTGTEFHKHCQSVLGKTAAVWGPKRFALWEAMFEMLKLYKATHGTCEVSKTRKGYDRPLDRWAASQARQLRAFDEDGDNCRLDEERINRLKELGLRASARGPTQMRVTEPTTPSWDEMFEQLKAFKEEKGHTEVPLRPKSLLRNWILLQRMEFDRMSKGKNTRLTPERLAKLTDIGLNVRVRRKVSFDQRAAEWLAHRAIHGKDPSIQSGPLGRWIGKTRHRCNLLKQGKKSGMTQERADKLTAWGFIWDKGLKKPEIVAASRPWAERYAQLLEYKVEHGHVNVPQMYPELGNWVHRQRQNYSREKRGLESNITAEKIEKLMSIGFVFLTRKSPLESRQDDGGQKKKKPGKSKKAQEADEESESSSEEEDDEDNNGYDYSQQNQNTAQFARNQMEFAPWDRYKM